MKRLFLALVALATFSSPAFAAIQVFACEPEWAALAKVIGGDAVDAYSASTALQDVHRIQPRPSLIAKYRQADLVVCTGAELEIGWLPPLVEKGNNPKVLPGSAGYYEASSSVKMLEVPSSVDRSLGDVHPYGNPHIQTDPRNIALVGKDLAEKLAALDGAHANDFRKRYADFAARWSDAVKGWEAKAKALKGVQVVSHHKTWVYLYDWLGIREVATLEPKPGIPPSGATLERVLGTVKNAPVKMVVYSSYEDPHASQWLSAQAHIPSVLLPFSVGGAPGADDLFGYYDVTVDRLVQALAGKGAS